MRKPLNMVLIEWTDSNITNGWHHKGCGENHLAYCRAVGILIGEDERGVTVAMGEGEGEMILEGLTIPKGCILSIKKLRVK